MNTFKFSKNKENNNEKFQKQQWIINDIKENLNSNSNNKQNLLQIIITEKIKM